MSAACAAVSAGLLVSCLIDIPDVATDGGCDGSGCGNPPPGSHTVLLSLDHKTQCPTGATQSYVAVDPAIGGACACGCTVTADPHLACQYSWAVGDAGCGYTIGGGESGYCVPSSGWETVTYWGFTPRAEVDACAPVSATDASAAAATSGLLCTCGGGCVQTAGFQTCFTSDASACPSGLTTHHVGSSVNVSCGSCDTCSVGCGGSVAVYAATDCSGSALVTMAADGGCAAVPPSTLGFTYNANASCTASAADGSVNLVNEQIVCCP